MILKLWDMGLGNLKFISDSEDIQLQSNLY